MSASRFKVPRIVPWRSSCDLLELGSLFYSPDLEDKKRAVSLYKAYQTRGPIAQSVDSTSLLVAAYINDRECSEKLCVRASYAFAIIRFVNGLLDPYQQGQFAISLHTLARNIGLPSAFVELRHVSTHETLPSLEALRLLNKNALKWLHDKYWACNNEHYEGHPDEPTTKTVTTGANPSTGNGNSEAIKDKFRAWRRVRRKSSLDTLAGDASDLASALSACPWADVISCMLHRNTLLPESSQNSSSISPDKVVSLYWPLLEWFPTTLLESLGMQLVSTCDMSDKYVAEWTRHLMAHLPVDSSDKMAHILAVTVSEANYRILDAYERKSGSVADMVDAMERQLDIIESRVKKPSRRRSMSSMALDIQKYAERLRSVPTNISGPAQKPGSLTDPDSDVWPTAENWTPRPIGIL